MAVSLKYGQVCCLQMGLVALRDTRKVGKPCEHSGCCATAGPAIPQYFTQDNSISTPKHILQILGENILVTLKLSPRIIFSILNRKS